jgi:hypothetical protein
VTTGGRRPQSWTYRFAVCDRTAAQVLADVLAASGFGEVGARPTPEQHLVSLGMGWEVIVVDDGPYPCGMVGLRQADAVERRARAIARAHGGFWCGGSTGPKYGSLERSAPPILRLSPGSQPAVPPLYLLLLMAAGCWRDDLILDADCAAALGRPARPGAWTGEVREAVGRIVPALLGRWAAEPPGNQVTLAALAAMFPHHGQGLCDLIATLAAKQVKTQAGAYAHLACMLIAGDSVAALAATRDIYGWHDGLTAFDIDNDLVEPGMRAERILSDAVTATVAAVRP